MSIAHSRRKDRRKKAIQAMQARRPTTDFEPFVCTVGTTLPDGFDESHVHPSLFLAIVRQVEGKTGSTLVHAFVMSSKVTQLPLGGVEKRWDCFIGPMKPTFH